MNTTKPDSLKLAYEGSVKRVWSSPAQSDTLWFEFTDDYSVFDWGKMPDTIARKGRALALFGAYFFDKISRKDFWEMLPSSLHLQLFDHAWLQERWKHPVFNGLSNEGIATHFRALVQGENRVSDLIKAARGSEPLLMEVLRAEVFRPVPRTITGNTIYFYDHNAVTAARRLIPLEIVFRFGLPSGSSLTERLAKDPGYASTLGLSRQPTPENFFEHPVIEMYTKLEPKDRLLTLQEAAIMSGLDGKMFEDMIELALDIALGLFVIFADRGIELWDGKIEMILADGQLMLADSIGPDELRLVHQGCHLSKEMIRQIYRGSQWEKAIHEAQKRAKSNPSRSWKQICVEDLNASPEPLSPKSKNIVDHLYGVITNHILRSEVFADHPSLNDFVRSLPSSPPANAPKKV